MTPEGWKAAIYSDVADINRESLGVNIAPETPLRYLDIAAVPSAGVIGSPSDLTFANAPSRARRVVRDGDTLVSTVRPYLRSFAFVPAAGDNLIASTGFAVLSPKDDVDARFLYQTVLRDSFAESLVARMKGSNYPAVNPSDVAETPLILPPLPEQKKIAEILGSVDEAIQATQAVIDQTRKVKQGLLQQLLTRGASEDEGRRQHKLWRLDEVATRGSGHTPNRKISSYWDGGIKWVSLQDSSRLDRVYISETAAEISEEGLANSSAVLHPANTVVLSRDAGVGKSAILADNMAVSQHFMAWRCGPHLRPLFLYYWLQRMKPVFEGIAVGSTIKTIGMPFFAKLQIPVPTLDEQERTSQTLLSLDRQIFGGEEEISQLSALKRGLMQDLLTGRVRVAA